MNQDFQSEGPVQEISFILFAREGASVLFVNRNQSKAAALQRKIEAEGGTCALVPADVAEADQRHALQPLQHPGHGGH